MFKRIRSPIDYKSNWQLFYDKQMYVCVYTTCYMIGSERLCTQLYTRVFFEDFFVSYPYKRCTWENYSSSNYQNSWILTTYKLQVITQVFNVIIIRIYFFNIIMKPYITVRILLFIGSYFQQFYIAPDYYPSIEINS